MGLTKFDTNDKRMTICVISAVELCLVLRLICKMKSLILVLLSGQFGNKTWNFLDEPDLPTVSSLIRIAGIITINLEYTPQSISSCR